MPTLEEELSAWAKRAAPEVAEIAARHGVKKIPPKTLANIAKGTQIAALVFGEVASRLSNLGAKK